MRALNLGLDIGKANPAPGNYEGGITTLEEKSLGAVQKGGRAAIAQALRYAERASEPGLAILEAPGNDAVSSTALVAAGATILLFTTGRGTTIGNAIAPIVKLTSNTPVYERMKRDMDLSAGGIIDGTETIEQVGARVLDHVIRVASGEVLARAEETKHREFEIWGEQSVSL
jgi:altronate dehydratase